jgi:hypothetical protein
VEGVTILNTFTLNQRPMKKILVLILVVASFFTITGFTPQQPNSKEVNKVKKETYVYICDSKTAYAFHSSNNCHGLNRCTHGILKVTKSDAVNKYGRVPCKICY